MIRVGGRRTGQSVQSLESGVGGGQGWALDKGFRESFITKPRGLEGAEIQPSDTNWYTSLIGLHIIHGCEGTKRKKPRQDRVGEMDGDHENERREDKGRGLNL